MHLLVVLLLAACAAPAQAPSAELRVTIVDPSGAPVEASGVLEALSPPGGARTSFAAGADGTYRFAYLPPGSYRLTVSHAGFESLTSDIEVDRAGIVERQLTLQVEAVSSTVVVQTLPASLDGVPGAIDELSHGDIETLRPFTVKEALRRMSGLHVVDEDAFGLNLNVSLRGLDPRRTQRTMLLEDGAPIHLSPYGDPSAHYHPTPDLIDSVELIKGSGQILHGPQTVGGVLNFVTEPVPTKLRAGFGAVMGNRDYQSFDAKLGGEFGRLGLLGNFARRQGDGVRQWHGHKVTQGRLKGLLRIGARQTLMVKGGYYEENSRFSEAGMSQDLFDTAPLSNPFRNDRFFLDRTTLQAVYNLEISDSVRLATNAYYQDISRASYRQIDFWGDEMTAVPATGCVGDDARTDYENFPPLCGNKMRPRTYEFVGVEPRLDWRGRLWGMRNEGVIGFRVHSEWIDRRRFNGFSPDARETDADIFFRDWNRIRVNAFPVFAQTTFYARDFTLTPGLRVENIRLRNRGLRRGDVPVDVEVGDNQSIALPGFGLTYVGLPAATFFAGVHGGLAPPRPDDNFEPTDPQFQEVTAERSTNYEAGVRSVPLRTVRLEATLFRIDFRNQIVAGEAVGLPQFTWVNAGRTLHEGAEIKAIFDLDSLLPTGHRFLLMGTYTRVFTAKFNSDSINGGLNVRNNRLPYAPVNLFTPSATYRHPWGWNLSFTAESVTEQFGDGLNQRTPSEDGSVGLIPGFTTYNASLNVPLGGSGLTLFASGTNLADKRYIASRVDGIHVGRPRQLLVGLQFER